MLPFCIGVSLGMICALLLKRTEMDKLNDLLKETEDLVQDLQEELEMKDSLSVKELADAMYENKKLKHWNSKSESSTEQWQSQKLMLHTTQDGMDCTHLNKDGTNSELLSNIEAELEAELERLELNINACSGDRRMSDLIKIDPDLIADVVQGELKAENLESTILEDETCSSSSTNSSPAHTYNTNFSVSPKELSLRLHQVIQSRLEGRIEELERELLQSQRQLQAMEAERVSSQRTFSNSDTGFSSNQESPLVIAVEPSNAVAHPLCLNLAGDALNAYDEVYEEFMKTAGKDDQTRTSPKCKSNSSCTSLPWENILWSRASNDTFEYEEEDGGSGSFTDEEGKLLIEQFMEKTRRSSASLSSAQKMFLHMDD